MNRWERGRVEQSSHEIQVLSVVQRLPRDNCKPRRHHAISFLPQARAIACALGIAPEYPRSLLERRLVRPFPKKRNPPDLWPLRATYSGRSLTIRLYCVTSEFERGHHNRIRSEVKNGKNQRSIIYGTIMINNRLVDRQALIPQRSISRDNTVCSGSQAISDRGSP